MDNHGLVKGSTASERFLRRTSAELSEQVRLGFRLGDAVSIFALYAENFVDPAKDSVESTGKRAEPGAHCANRMREQNMYTFVRSTSLSPSSFVTLSLSKGLSRNARVGSFLVRSMTRAHKSVQTAATTTRIRPSGRFIR
jgi:hypothetical protein